MASVWDGILPARPDYGKEQNLRDIVRLTPAEEAQNAREDASPSNLRQLDEEMRRFGDPTGALATERARLTGDGIMPVSNQRAAPQKSVWDGVLPDQSAGKAEVRVRASVWDGILPDRTPGIYVPRWEPEKAAEQPGSRADLGLAKGAFAYVNDFVINTGNQIFGVGKALSDFASPGNPVSKALDGLIEAGQSSQSDWQRQQNQNLAEALQNADGEWDKVKIYFTHSIVNDPLKLLADAGGNLGPFWALGKSLQAANLSREAAQKITMRVAGAMGAGEVRGNIYAKIQAIPDADLQAESPEYADLRKTLTEAEAKHQFGSQFVKHLPEIAVTAVVGALGGKYGLEALAAGVGPKLGRLGSAALGAAEEVIQGAVEQAATNVGTRRLVPSQSLTEDVALNAAMEGLVGGVGGAAFSNRRQPETAPPVPGVAPRTGTVAPPTAPAAPAVPAFDIVTGKDTAVALPNGQQVGAQYIVMEASRLQTPVHPSGAVNPNYPAGMAGPIDLAAQQRIASEFVPDLVGDQEQASMGAPVIGADGIVEVGAKRAAALKGLYETEKGQTYKDWLLANAQRFGIADTAKVAEMRKPVLVRLRTAETDRAAFAQAARMTPRDVIRERADALRQKYSPLRPAVAPVAPQTQPVTQPVTAPTQSAKSDPNVVDPGRDDLFTAIAKLGGINYEAARAEWGLDPADWKRFPRPVFGKPVLHKSGGRSLDAMAEALHQLGYLDQQDLNELFDKFDRHLGGTPVYTPAGYEAQAAREAEERREEELRSPLATVDELAAADQETVSKVVDDLLAEFTGTEAMTALEEILERVAVETQDGSPADFDAAIMKRLKEVLDEDPGGQPAQEAGRADAEVRQETDSRASQAEPADPAREEVDAAAGEAVDGGPQGPAIGSDAKNGFKHGPNNERYRVTPFVSSTGGVMMEKRYKNGTIGAFYVGIEGNLLDADAINLVGPSKALIWVPRTAAAREQAAAILEQLAQLPLTDPRRKALKEVLRKVVSDDINGGGPNMVATDAAAPEAATSPRNDDRLPKGDEPAGERPGRAAKEKRSAAREASQAGGARFSRTITSDDDFSSTVLTILADVVDLYQQPKVEAKSMEDIAQAIDPGIKVTRIPAISKRMEKKWSFTMPDGKVADAWLYKDGAVVLDASRLVEGESRGSALYGILAAFAHNNGKRFIGDPSGLSDAALFRRTEHMIATAMKFGTTEHIYPHERQVAEGLKWDDKPGANNLKNLLDFSRQLMERELPEIADLRYNFESRQFETADGKPYRQADFDALAQSGGARKARAGSTTLKRAALLQSLVRATSPEARRGILGEVARQLREVLDPDLVETYYSRTTSPAVAGLSVSELEDVVSKVSTPGAKRITIVATEADLPAKVVARLRSEGVTGVRGMFDPKTDSIWLVAGNIMSPEEAAFVLMHEGVHRGLRVFFGNDLTPILQQIYDTNRSVALRADLYRAKHKIDLMEAIEEVLADMAMKGDAKTLKGWDKLVAFIRKWVKELGDRLGVKLEFTDEMVERLVGAASTAGLRDDVSVFDDRIAKVYGIKRSSKAPVFVSKLAEFIAEKGSTATPAEWRQRLDAWVKAGNVKADEVEWSGVKEWLASRDGKMGKGDVLDYLQEGGVRVTETVLGEGNTHNDMPEWGALNDEHATGTKFGKYTLPGGENYRELLLTLPDKPVPAANVRIEPRGEYEGSPGGFNAYVGDEFMGWGRDEQAARVAADGNWQMRQRRLSPPFKSGHFDEENVVAHVRFNERTDAEGRKVLFIEEIQSDWAASGRKQGFAGRKAARVNEIVAKANSERREVSAEERAEIDQIMASGEGSSGAVPSAPYVRKTEAYTALAIKRMIRWAAENGFEAISWTTGDQQNERYDLSKQVDAIRVMSASNESKVHVFVKRKGGRDFERLSEVSAVDRGKLADVIGKDLAEKALDSIARGQDPAEFSGIELKVGGEGMRAYYDKIVPNVAKDVLKKLGGGNLTTMTFHGKDRDPGNGWSSTEEDVAGHPAMTQPGFLITPAMRDRAMQGMPLFSRPIPVAQQAKNAVQKRRGYKGAAQVIVDRIDRAITPLGSLPNVGRYLKDRYQALGKIANADAIGKSLYDAFAKHAPETQQQVYEYLTTRDADENDIVDANARQSAVRAKQTIEQVGEQLVARGLLEPAAMEAHRGAYLPRLYLKHMLTEADSRAIGAGKKPSSMGYLKARRDIPEDVRQVILGEIKDPGFLSAVGVTRAMRDMAILDWLAQISKEKEWILPESMVEFEGREVSVLWLKAEADRIRQQIPYYTGSVKARAEDLVKRMDAVVTPRLAELQSVPEDFKQMPDSPRYGHLRGLYVRKEIYDDIVGVGAVVPKDAGFMEKLLGYGGWATKATQLWKASKVSLNPPAQIRNFLSNAVLLQLSGVPLHMVPVRLAQAANELRTNGRYAQIAKKHGVSVASFAAQELLHIERDFIDLKARMRGPWSLMNLVNIGAKIMDKAGNLYQWSESLYKTAKIIDEMEKGASEGDAAIEAHKWLMDYSLVGPNIRYARNAPVGIPFLTFYSKLAPRLAEVALHHPQRFAPWAIMAYTLPMIIAAMGGPDREEQEKLKKLLPEFWQDKGHVYVLPYKDEHGRWQAIDISYLMPWTMFDTVARKTVQGDIKSAVEATGILGGPIPDIISAWKTGKDPFTGRDIVNPGDPQHLQWGSLLTYVYNLAMPPVITNRGLIGPDFGDPLHAIQGRLPSAVRGSTNKYGDTVSTVKQAAAGAAGFNTRSVNPNERALKLNRMRAEMNDVKDRLKRSLGDRAISSEERKRLLKTYADEIRRRQEKIKEFAQATQ